MDALLSVENMATHFFTRAGVVKAVDDISFSVAEGETVGIVGESGCGKSATVLSIMQLIPDPPGKTIGGKILFSPGDGGQPLDLRTMNEHAMQKIRGNDVAMVFQDPMTSLNPVLTIGWQLREPLQIHMGMNKREARDRSIELMHLVNIPSPETRLDDYPHQFSGGMRQRVMIAMAIACNPRLLIADEPTTALDVTVQAQILDLMAKMQKERGMATLLITHDLGVIAEQCDEVVVMYAGRVVERAPVKELFANPKHAYTKGLLASIPRLDNERKTQLQTIPGQVASIHEFASGCRFCQRMDRGGETVKTRPAYEEVKPGRFLETCPACT